MTTQHKNFKNISGGSQNDALPMYIYLKIPNLVKPVPLRPAQVQKCTFLNQISLKNCSMCQQDVRTGMLAPFSVTRMRDLGRPLVSQRKIYPGDLLRYSKNYSDILARKATCRLYRAAGDYCLVCGHWLDCPHSTSFYDATSRFSIKDLLIFFGCRGGGGGVR
jgi:hypothetical protein